MHSARRSTSDFKAHIKNKPECRELFAVTHEITVNWDTIYSYYPQKNKAKENV